MRCLRKQYNIFVSALHCRDTCTSHLEDACRAWLWFLWPSWWLWQDSCPYTSLWVYIHRYLKNISPPLRGFTVLFGITCWTYYLARHQIFLNIKPQISNHRLCRSSWCSINSRVNVSQSRRIRAVNGYSSDDLHHFERGRSSCWVRPRRCIGIGVAASKWSQKPRAYGWSTEALLSIPWATSCKSESSLVLCKTDYSVYSVT